MHELTVDLDVAVAALLLLRSQRGYRPKSKMKYSVAPRIHGFANRIMEYICNKAEGEPIKENVLREIFGNTPDTSKALRERLAVKLTQRGEA